MKKSRSPSGRPSRGVLAGNPAGTCHRKHVALVDGDQPKYTPALNWSERHSLLNLTLCVYASAHRATPQDRAADWRTKCGRGTRASSCRPQPGEIIPHRIYERRVDARPYPAVRIKLYHAVFTVSDNQLYSSERVICGTRRNANHLARGYVERLFGEV